MQLRLTTDLLLEAYSQGIFPMAHAGNSRHIHWICPPERALLSIEGVHIPRRLAKTLRQGRYRVTVNENFESVIKLCAEAAENRPETWINDEIMEGFIALHRLGHAHSLEILNDEGMIGGIYGLQIGAAFFGESMVSRARDGSKIALAHLAARLWKAKFKILDVQFVNDHLRQFGVYEIPHEDYMRKLQRAMAENISFTENEWDDHALIRDFLVRSRL